MYYITTLNSEDFLKFFQWLGILFLTYSYENTHEEVQKNSEFWSNIPEYSRFFDFFKVYHIHEKTVLVIFVPIYGVKPSYWFHFEKWNSYIYSDEKSGTVLSIPID